MSVVTVTVYFTKGDMTEDVIQFEEKQSAVNEDA